MLALGDLVKTDILLLKIWVPVLPGGENHTIPRSVVSTQYHSVTDGWLIRHKASEMTHRHLGVRCGSRSGGLVQVRWHLDRWHPRLTGHTHLQWRCWRRRCAGCYGHLTCEQIYLVKITSLSSFDIFFTSKKNVQLWCQLTWVVVEKGPQNEFIISLSRLYKCRSVSINLHKPQIQSNKCAFICF